MYQHYLIFLVSLLISFRSGAGEDIKQDINECEETIFTERKPLPQELENCIYLLESSEEYSTSRPWVIDIAKARLQLALFNFRGAAHSFGKINSVVDRLSNNERFRYYIMYSTALDFIGELDEAIEILNRGIEETIEVNDSSMLLQMYVQKGSCHKLTSRLDSAIYYYRQAMSIADRLNDTRSKAIIQLNYGTLYLDMQLPVKARACYNKALDLATRCNDLSIKIVALSNLGALLYSEGKYDSSIAHSLKLQQLLKTPETKSIQDIESYAYTLFILGNNYTKTGEYKKAVEHYTEACAYFKDMNDRIGLFAIYQCLNNFYLTREDYTTSIKYGDSVLLIAEKTGLYNGIGDTYGNLAKAYEAREEYRKANVYHKLERDFDAEAYDLGKVVSLEDAIIESGLMDKTRELDEAKSKMEFLHKYKKALTTGLILAIVLSSAIVYAYQRSRRKNKSLARNYKRKEKYIREQEDKLKLQQMKINELQSDNKLPLVLPNGKCIQPEDIIYIKSEDHYLTLKMKDNTRQVFRSSLAQFGKKLPSSLFLRVHYSYIINLSEIVSVRTKDVVMANGEAVKIGPTYSNQFKEAIAV